MLTLILGRGKSGKTTALLDAVRRCPAQGMAQRVLIVPEQMSHQTERLLSQTSGDSISYTTEVLSFTRLHSRVCAEYGGGARLALDRGGRLLTARLALDGVLSRLKVFAQAAGRADFLESMVAMIDEFKAYGVDPAQLLEAADRTEGAFSQKLLELGTILGAYDAVMAQGSCDPRDRLTLLRDKLLTTGYAAGRHFFVDGFTDFTAQELGVLDALLRRGESLTVALPYAEAPDQLFAPGRETALRLIRMAGDAGQAVTRVETAYQRPLPPALQKLERELFTYGAEPWTDGGDAIIRFTASDCLGECRHCAAELRRLAMDGVRWRDMAVAVGNTAVYGPILEAVCRAYGVPLLTGIKRPLAAHPAVAYVLCALEAAVEGMETDAVIACLRTGCSGLTDDQCDAVENYALTWSIRGGGWQRTWVEHPDGYDGRFTQRTAGELDRLNQARQQAAEPLVRLGTALRTAGNLRGQVLALYRFLEDVALYDQTRRRVEEQTAAGDLEDAQETAQVWNTLMECLQQMAAVLGETAQSGAEFLKLLRLALSQYELGTIPAVLDAVRFGGVDSLRGAEPRVLFVLGIQEGELPTIPAGNSLLTERERGLLLEEMGIELAPDSLGAMERQLLQAYGTLTAPTERLYLSWAQSRGGEALRPSFLLERVGALFPGAAERDVSDCPEDAMTLGALTELTVTAGPSAALAEVERQVPELAEAVERARSAASERGLLVPDSLTRRMFLEPVKLTASKLDELGRCPLRFFLRYGLQARQRETASFDAREYGTFMHYILEHTVADAARAGLPLPLDRTESQRLVDRYMGPYLNSRLQEPEALDHRQSYLYRRNSDEAALLLTDATRELADSQFEPWDYELRFGAEQSRLIVQGDRGQGLLDGTVDRVDLWRGPAGDYFRIIDYKTGSRTFDYTDLYHNVGMQLFLYLFALERSGLRESERPVPAGALYFPARWGYFSASGPMEPQAADATRRTKSKIRRSGLVLGDEQVLSAMEQSPGERYIPVKKPSKKSLRAGEPVDRGEFAITAGQMALLREFVDRRMAQAVDRIYGGDFAPRPYYRGPTHDPCATCDFSRVCQKDEGFRRGYYQETVKAKDFWESLGGEADGG